MYGFAAVGVHARHGCSQTECKNAGAQALYLSAEYSDLFNATNVITKSVGIMDSSLKNEKYNHQRIGGIIYDRCSLCKRNWSIIAPASGVRRHWRIVYNHEHGK